MKKVVWLAMVAMMVFVGNVYSEGASFSPLSTLAGEYFASDIYDMSADGRVVVGRNQSLGSSAYRLSLDDGYESLQGVFDAIPFGISGDGSTIVGQGLKWTREYGTQTIPTFPGESYARVISASYDGSVIVGTSGPTNRNPNATVWRGTDMMRLGVDSSCVDVSHDGSVVVGWQLFNNDRTAFRWTEDGGMVLLDRLDATDEECTAMNISGDGSSIVGFSGWQSDCRAVMWKDGQVINLGSLPNSIYSQGYPYGVSQDGSVVVGTYCNHAFIWDSQHGMRKLSEVLENEYGLDLGGFFLIEARAISDDGLVIAGNGRNSDGCTEAWIATIPEPCTLLLLGLGGLGLLSRVKK